MKGGKNMESLLLEIIPDDENSEQGWIIRCTDEDDNAIEIYGFDTVYSTKEEAQEALKNIVNRLKRRD